MNDLMAWQPEIIGKFRDLFAASREKVIVAPDPTRPKPAPKPDAWEAVSDLFKVGSVVSGTVQHLTDYGAFVCLAPGIQGMIHISDMSEDMAKHPADLVSVGQKLDVMVLRIKKAQRKIKLGLKQLSDIWSSVETKYAAGQKVKGKVIRFKNNGVIVELEPGVAGFVHATEISWSTQKKAPSEAFTPGQEVMAVVLEINVRKKRMSLSIRQLETDPWHNVEAKYSIGTKVTSTAYKLMPFGALVELDGCIGGLVHVSDMSWLRKIKHPSEFLTKGDEIEAVVLRVDQANRRLALGIKQLVRDPWETIDQLYKVGDHVAGKVVKLTGFGAFVELSHEFQGLVHMSRISEQPVDDVKNVLQVGQEVSVHIIKIDRDERRIGLSMLAT